MKHKFISMCPYVIRIASVSYPSIFRSLHVAIFDGYGRNTDGEIWRYDVILLFPNNSLHVLWSR